MKRFFSFHPRIHTKTSHSPKNTAFYIQTNWSNFQHNKCDFDETIFQLSSKNRIYPIHQNTHKNIDASNHPPHIPQSRCIEGQMYRITRQFPARKAVVAIKENISFDHLYPFPQCILSLQATQQCEGQCTSLQPQNKQTIFIKKHIQNEYILKI